jgi:hypothetical protein
MKTDWPFKSIILESSILSLLPLQETTKAAILFRIGSYYLVLDKTLDLLDIDYNISTVGDTTIRWQLIRNTITIDQIQDLTNSLVVIVSA